MVHKKAPNYLVKLVPKHVHERTDYSLRNRGDLTIEKPSSETFRKSFVPGVTKMWNSLDTNLRQIPDLDAFKQALTNQITLPNPLFYQGDRKLSIVLARMRMNCSDLKAHLFDLGIIADATCRCGYPREDTVHFFMTCPLYNNSRATLHNLILPLTQFTVRNILYGNQNLELNANISILNGAINYVKQSRRFNL